MKVGKKQFWLPILLMLAAVASSASPRLWTQADITMVYMGDNMDVLELSPGQGLPIEAKEGLLYDRGTIDLTGFQTMATHKPGEALICIDFHGRQLVELKMIGAREVAREEHPALGTTVYLRVPRAELGHLSYVIRPVTAQLIAAAGLLICLTLVLLMLLLRHGKAALGVGIAAVFCGFL